MNKKFNFNLKCLITLFGLFLYPCLSYPAPIPAYGTWLSYFPTNRQYLERTNINSGSYIGPVGVKQVPDSSPRFDVYNGISGSACHPYGWVEEWKVKTCSMTNMATGVVTNAQFAVYL